jgi:predicted transposase/invertase (TIGR01784 family)
MNKKFISKSNRVLRKVLNSKENLDILQDFIETFLKIKIQKIQLNPYLEIKSKNLPAEENFGIADVRIKLENREELNVGIQFIDGYYAQNKMLLYYAQIHSNQLEYQDNRKIAKTVTINLLDFNYLKSENYFNKIIIPSKAVNQIELYVLELPKFIPSTCKVIEKKEAWMTYLCGEREKQIIEVLKGFDKIQKLDKLLDEYWKNEVME